MAGIGLERATASFPGEALPPSRVVLVGAGRVGTAVAELLRRRGHTVAGVASRSPSSAQRAAEFLGATVCAPGAPLPVADIVLIGATGDALEEVAGVLAADLQPPVAVCHFAGALGIAPLRAIVERGGAVCAVHPVQALPDVATALRRLPGSAWGVTCSPGAEAWATVLVARELEGKPVAVSEEDRILWHAAAALTSNGIAALLSAGEGVLGSMGIDAPEEVLGPLAAGTSANAAEHGAASAVLTGPVVRGEVSVVRAHMRALEDRAPMLLRAYRLAAKTVLAEAQRTGRIDAATERALRRALETP
jgi:predicted short-subunit dehydrogenase-like oxidoreductase (DUF2520 family)